MEILQQNGMQFFNSINIQLPIYKLDHDVISCVQASSAKKISIKNELKTLILETSIGLYTINTTGENEVSLHKIKKHIKAKEVCLACPQILKQLNVIPGTVCPFLDSVFNLPMLIDERILELHFLSTNNGTRNKFIIFPPNLLLLSPDHQIGNFNKEIRK